MRAILAGLLAVAACGHADRSRPPSRLAADLALTSTAPVASVTLAPALVAIKTNDTLQLVATLKDSAGNILTGRLVTWAASNGNVSVTQTGLVVGKSTNHANVTATSEGKVGLSSIFIIWSTTVTPGTATDTVGRSVQLTATLRDRSGALINSTPPTGAPITWTTSNTAVATVGVTGLVRGVAVGTATIRATSGGISGSSAVTVVGTAPPLPPPGIAGITVSPTSVGTLLVPGFIGIVRFKATVFDSIGTVVVKAVGWSSSDTTVALVDTSGNVSMTGTGTATITATIGAFQASGHVTVDLPPPRAFNGIYADVALRNGRLKIVRRDSAGVPPIVVSVGDTSAAAFRVRVAPAPLYAAAVRQMASDLASRRDTVRFPAITALGTDSVFCASIGCWVTTTAPGHAAWTSNPPVSAATLVGLAHALEAAARGDTLFASSDSLPYVRSVP